MMEHIYNLDFLGAPNSFHYAIPQNQMLDWLENFIILLIFFNV